MSTTQGSTTPDEKGFNALVSVFDKAHIAKLLPLWETGNWNFYSTGGTAKALRELGIEVTDVEKLTGVPQMLGDRVKTLAHILHGGILADPMNEEHERDVKTHRIVKFDLVAVNLYDFDGQPGIDRIDIGGPAMLRGAAKNYENGPLVVIDPDDYEVVVKELLEEQIVSPDTRIRLAGKVFRTTSVYDGVIADWFATKRAEMQEETQDA